jgi:hypothetical protein
MLKWKQCGMVRCVDIIRNLERLGWRSANERRVVVTGLNIERFEMTELVWEPQCASIKFPRCAYPY